MPEFAPDFVQPLQVLVTAGPTREYIDDVRYLTNRSSGRMGIELARAMAATGARVTLVAGPCEVPLPWDEPRITVVEVVSGQQMFDAVADRFARCDVFVSAAAVADYRPTHRVEGKLKKTDSALQLELEPNPDVLLEMGQRRTSDHFIVGFALEVADAGANARSKLNRKNCDVIVLNSPANFGLRTSELRLIGPEGEFEKLIAPDKTTLAERLCSALMARRAGSLASA
ncbi:MAG: phosphopantothenoylcysteine decarboxylase [Planctomycetota bacterium]